MNSEIRKDWRPVLGYEGLYEVSCLGSVRSLRSDMILKPYTTTYRYLRVMLYARDGSNRNRSIHSLVLESFIGPRPKGFTANHKNSDRTDNRVENLEWVTMKENIGHRERMGRGNRIKGEKSNLAKLTNSDATAILKRCALGERPSQIAKDFGVHPVTIRDIRRGKSWAHLYRHLTKLRKEG